MAYFDKITRRVTRLRQPHGLASHLGRLVADSLQVRVDLDDRHHQAQVTGRGLAPGENRGTLVIDGHLHLVDLVVPVDDQFGLATVHCHQRLYGAGQLLLDFAAHLQHKIAQCLELCVELA